MKTSTLVNAILIIALVAAIAIIIFSGKQSQTKVDDKLDMPMVDTADIVYNNLLTRVSVRKYVQQPIARTMLDKIVRAGLSAPSAGNKQPWQVLVIDDCTQLQIMADSLSSNIDFASAGAVLVVCGDLARTFEGEGRDYWVQDASAMTENMLLAAHGFGLGAVWTGVYPISDRVQRVHQVLTLPENIVPLCVIAMGWPAENPTPKDKWDVTKVHYNHW